MKLNEYLTENGVKLMIKGSGENYPPRQTNDLGMYDYAECRASDFFWATAAVEFAGIDKMTLKEVLAAV
mgnify:FL=1